MDKKTDSIKNLVLLLFFLFLLLACQTFLPIKTTPSDTENPQTNPTEKSFTVSPIVTVAIAPNENTVATEEKIVGEDLDLIGPDQILFDNFEDFQVWPEFDEADSYGNYFGGGYRIGITNPNLSSWMVRGAIEQDILIEVSTALMGGGTNNNFGLVCRYHDKDNFVLLTISSDGFYAIRQKSTELGIEFLGSESFLYTDKIRIGNQWNKIVAECNGEYLRLFVNNQLILESIDPNPKSGQSGLIVGNFAQDFSEVLFDNLYFFQIP